LINLRNTRERVTSKRRIDMTRSINRTIARLATGRFAADMFLVPHVTSLEQVRDDERLRRALKRAVGRDLAPQSLIDSIKSGIRQQ
jgi:hypothetical protein